MQLAKEFTVTYSCVVAYLCRQGVDTRWHSSAQYSFVIPYTLGSGLELWVDYSYVIADIKRSKYLYVFKHCVDTFILYITDNY